MAILKCTSCGGNKMQAYGNGVYKCLYCGAVMHEEQPKTAPQPQQQIVPQQFVQVAPMFAAPQQPVRQRLHDRNKTTAALLSFFLGTFGAHWIYLGKIGKGLLYPLFIILGFWTITLPIGIFIATLVEGIKFLMMDEKDFDEKYNYQ